MKVKALIFSDLSGMLTGWSRSLGPHRIANSLRVNGYKTEVIDFCLSLRTDEIINAIDQYCDDKTLFISWSSTFLTNMDFTKNSNDQKYINTRMTSFGEQNKEVILNHIRDHYPKAKVVVGGGKAHCYGIPEADIFVLGYGDSSVVELAHWLSGKASKLEFKRDSNDKIFIDSNKDYPINDMSKVNLKWQKSDFLLEHEYVPIEISRGCRFKCAFCAYPFNGKKVFDYLRPMEQLKDEILYNFENFGLTKYHFMDDTHNDSVEKLQIINKALNELPFKIKFTAYIRLDLLGRYPEMFDLLLDSGLESAYFGIESLDRNASRIIGKPFDIDKCIQLADLVKKKSPELKTCASFIVGLPEETEKSIRETHEWLVRESPFHLWEFNHLHLSQYKYTEYASRLSLHPEKYGIDFDPDSSHWSHKTMDRKLAQKLTEELNKEDDGKKRLGGWSYSLVKSIGPEVEYVLDYPLTGNHWMDVAAKKSARARDYLHKKTLNTK